MTKLSKRVLSCFLAVLMMAFSAPLEAFAWQEIKDYHPNLDVKFSTFWNMNDYSFDTADMTNDADATWDYSGPYAPPIDATIVKDKTNGSINITKLTRKAAKTHAFIDFINEYQEIADTEDEMPYPEADYDLTTGDYFVATFTLENIDALSFLSTAISYSNNIEPAGAFTYKPKTKLTYGIGSVSEAKALDTKGNKEWLAGGQLPATQWSIESIYPTLNLSTQRFSNVGGAGLCDEDGIAVAEPDCPRMFIVALAEDGYKKALPATTASPDEDFSFVSPEDGSLGYEYDSTIIASFVFKITGDFDASNPINFGVYNADNNADGELTGVHEGGSYTQENTAAPNTYATYAPEKQTPASEKLTIFGMNIHSGEGCGCDEHVYGTEGAARYTCTVCGAVDEDLKAAAEAADKLAEDQAAADAVAGTINALPATITTADEDAIEAARSAYDALTDDQKALVDSAVLTKLTDAEAALEAAKAAEAEAAANQAAADAAAEKINALPATDTITTADKAVIEEARAAYDALTDAQKALVDSATLKKLTDAEAAFTAAEAAEAAANQAAANAVADAINDLPATVTTEDKVKIEAARAAYDALTDYQKTLVDSATLKKLTDAEEALAAAEKAAADQAAADAVADVINSIPATVTTADKNKIEGARDAYDALTDDQKALVDSATLTKLTDAEAALAAAEKAAADQAAADAAVEKINAIPAEVTTADEAAIKAARAAYDALTDDQKALVDSATLTKLTDAETALAEAKEAEAAANQAAADAATEAINAIPATVTTEDEEAIVAARTAYDALTDAQKALLPSDALSKLEAAETALEKAKADAADVAAAEAAETIINDVPVADAVTTADKEKIEAAREAYDNLTDAQKALVSNEALAKLEAAEEALAAAEKAEQEAAEKEAADQKAADEAAETINALPADVTTADEEAIVAARAAYDALTEDQKAKVPAETLDKLTDAEIALADAKAAEAAEKEAADQKAADDATAKIDEVPAADAVTTADKEKIEAARAAYDALTDDQKAKVSEETLAKLTAAEAALAAAQEKEAAEKDAADQAAADSAKSAIDALPAADKVTTADKAKIEAARKAYDALTDAQKAKVSAETLKKLTDAETALAAAQKAASTPTTKPAETKKADKITLKLNKKIKIKKSAKKITIKATLKINGKAVKGKKVTFKVAGKKFTAKTNKKGVAKLVIKGKKLKKLRKKLKAGKKIKIKATFGGKTVTKKVKVKK